AVSLVALRVAREDLELPPVDAALRVELVHFELGGGKRGTVERRHVARAVECPADDDGRLRTAPAVRCQRAADQGEREHCRSRDRQPPSPSQLLLLLRLRSQWI